MERLKKPKELKLLAEKKYPFGLRKWLDPVVEIFFKNANKNTSGGLILYLENMAWSYTVTFFKKYLCSENHKFRFDYFWTCDFHFINIFWKKLEYRIKPKFSKYKIRPPLVIFFKNAEKISTTRSSGNFLSPESNGQGYKKKY